MSGNGRQLSTQGMAKNAASPLFFKAAFFLVGEKGVMLRGAQPQKLEFSPDALQSQVR